MNKNAELELNELAALIDRLRRGELTRPEFRSHSVHYGVYTQRQPDRYFVRIRVPLGILTVAQLNALAETTDRWANGVCHLTTRQGVEIHNLSLDGTLESLAALASVGLSSHESGGNTVRGIVVCPHAGQGQGEPFDVTEYAALLNRHFLRHPDFQSLPRKIKIGFSCCADDCTQTALQDLGFQARRVSGKIGFRVLVGGGAGALPRLGKELFEFLLAEDIVIFTEAFLRMFNRLGDRQNRRRSRVKFLVESLGLERLRQEIIAEWNTLKAAGTKWPSVKPSGRRSRAESSCAVRASVRGGNLTSSQLRQVAAIVECHALTLRTTPEQDFLLHDIRPDQLSEIKTALLEAGLVPKNAALRLVACPGSTACSNAFTNSRALAQVIAEKLAGIGGANGDEPLRIRVSGCTNGCALHVIADIGLEGLAQRRDGALIPAYRSGSAVAAISNTRVWQPTSASSPPGACPIASRTWCCFTGASAIPANRCQKCWSELASNRSQPWRSHTRNPATSRNWHLMWASKRPTAAKGMRPQRHADTGRTQLPPLRLPLAPLFSIRYASQTGQAYLPPSDFGS